MADPEDTKVAQLPLTEAQRKRARRVAPRAGLPAQTAERLSALAQTGAGALGIPRTYLYGAATVLALNSLFGRHEFIRGMPDYLIAGLLLGASLL